MLPGVLLHMVKPPRPIDFPTHNFLPRRLSKDVRDLLSLVNDVDDLDAREGPGIRRLPSRGRIKGCPVKVDLEAIGRSFRTEQARLELTQITIGVVEPVGFCHMLGVGATLVARAAARPRGPPLRSQGFKYFLIFIPA